MPNKSETPANGEDVGQPTSEAQLAATNGYAAMMRLLTAASLMRIAIKERATFLTKTTDWERLEDAMRGAERELKRHTEKLTDHRRG